MAANKFNEKSGMKNQSTDTSSAQKPGEQKQGFDKKTSNTSKESERTSRTGSSSDRPSELEE